MSFLWHGLTEQGAQVPVQVDAQGRVIAVDGTPGVSNWERTGTTLSPAVPGDSVDIGSGNITLNASGSAEFAGKVDVTTPTVGNYCARFFSNGGTNDVLFIEETSEVGSVPFETAILRIGKTFNGASINAGGSATFAGNVISGSNPYQGAAAGSRLTANGNIYAATISNGDVVFGGYTVGDTSLKVMLRADGNATFAGNITAANVTFRSSDPQFYVKKSKNIDALPEYVGPELDLLAEIARLEALVRHLYETLRITPPAGWPVWDGNDDVLRQVRK